MQATAFNRLDRKNDWIRKSFQYLKYSSNENKFKHVRKKATLLITKIFETGKGIL